MQFFLILLIISRCLVSSFSQQSEKKTLSQHSFLSSLTADEQFKLKIFFYQLFTETECGYTLFFEKPMCFSFIHFSTIESKLCPLRCLDPEYASIMANGISSGFCSSLINASALTTIDSWRKIKSNFSMPNYLFLDDDLSYQQDAIFLINKKAFIEAVDKHLTVFQKELGKDISGEKLLSQIESRKLTIMENLKFNDELIGILLGYGHHNALLFKQRKDLKMLVSNLFLKENSFRKKLKNLEDRLGFYSSILLSFPLCVVTPICFAYDSKSLQSQQLVKKYEKERAYLTEMFKEENWFETILKRLTE